LIWPPLECNQPGVRMDWGRRLTKPLKVQVTFEGAVPELRYSERAQRGRKRRPWK
jgi:hypothetical protein